jgi:hypothetical protein
MSTTYKNNNNAVNNTLTKVLIIILMIIATVQVNASISLIVSTAPVKQLPIDLGTANNFSILAKSGVSTTGETVIVGNIGVSPIAATSITGFALVMDLSNQFSTSSSVTGKIYAADYAVPTPAMLTESVSDMETAYNDAIGRGSPDYLELNHGYIGGLTLQSGLYKWNTAVIIPKNVNLNGTSTDVWIFQVESTLSISSGIKINLIGEANANNVFWVVSGQATLGKYSFFIGNIISKTAIVFNIGATLNGRALAQTAVTLDSNTITIPIPFVFEESNTSITSTVTSTSDISASSNSNSVFGFETLSIFFSMIAFTIIGKRNKTQ